MKGKNKGRGKGRAFPQEEAQNSLSWCLLLEFLFVLPVGLSTSHMGMIPLV